MEDAVIASVVRTPVGKAPRGYLRGVRPDDLAAIAMREALNRVPQLDINLIEDVILGCATPEAEQGLNVARVASFRAGMPDHCSGMTINRYCASGLQAIAIAADRIRASGAQAIVAGGTESMSHVPFQGHRVPLNPWLVENYPGSYMSMGLTAERVAERYGVKREAMDEFSYHSHRKALGAVQAGRFKEETIAVPLDAGSMKEDKPEQRRLFTQDEGPRPDTSPEALARLKPVFHAQGVVTAGNSSQTSDGAAAAVVMSGSLAKELNIRPLGRFIAFAHAGCDPTEMGMGPAFAVPKALGMAGLSLDDIGLVELNEAFAAQALAVIERLSLDPRKVNVNGGAIALGHPLGCTGVKLMATLLYEMKRRAVRFGMVTMCVGGGMGAAGIFELG